MTKFILFSLSLFLNITFIHGQWNTNGNTASPSNFLGTTNNISLRINTNNQQRMIIDSNGRIGIGIALPRQLFTIQGSGSVPTASWINAGSPLFSGFGENIIGNADFVMSMASNTINARPVFVGRRSRGTLSLPVTNVNNDFLMSFLASGFDGTSFQNPSSIDFYVDGTPSAGNVPARISFVTGSNSSNRTERLKIASNGDISINNNQLFIQQSTGNVGVGTTNPLQKLHLVGSSLTTGNALVNGANFIDASNTNNGTLSAGGSLRFGDAATGEAIISKRTTGGNQYGLDFLTGAANRLTITNGGYVGIGTNTPKARLHVADSGVVFTGGTTLNFTTANPPVQGAGIRTMWYPEKAAFRTGAVLGANWDRDSIGYVSFASGYDTKASGQGSVAMGILSTASLDYAIAIGRFSTASNYSSVAIGEKNNSSGAFAAAFGILTNARGESSASFGSNTITKARGSFVSGTYNDTLDNPSNNVSAATDRIFQLGNGEDGARSNALTVLRNGSTGIGTTIPAAKLDIVGNIKITDGTQGAGKVLKSDANGLGSWGNVSATDITGTLPSANFNCSQLVGLANFATSMLPWDIAILGQNAFIVNNDNGGMLNVVNINNKALPTVVSNLNIGTQTTGIAINNAGTHAFVVNSLNNNIRAINITTPATPVITSTLTTNNTPTDIEIAGNYAYVTCSGNNTLQVFDISNPAAMSVVASVATANYPTAIAVSGSLAYIINSNAPSLQVVDISNPTVPSVKGSVTIMSDCKDIAVQNGYAYTVSTSKDSLVVVNVKNPNAPVIVARAKTNSNPYKVSFSGNYLYVASLNSSTLEAFNVTTPLTPSLAGTIKTGTGPSAVTIVNNYAYVGNMVSSLQIFALSPCTQILSIDPTTGAATGQENLWQAAGNNIYNLNTANVGIGTNTPSTARLVIKGNAGAQGLDLSSSDQYANMRVLQNTNNVADKDMYIGFQSGTNSSLHLFSNNNETVTVKANNVGIGTTTPADRLHIYGTGSQGVMLESPTGGTSTALYKARTWAGIAANTFAAFGGTDDGNGSVRASIYVPNSSNNGIYEAVSVVKSNGNFGIGNPTPADKLDVVGFIRSQGYRVRNGVGGTTGTNLFNFNWNGSSLQAWIDNVNVGTITLTSDRRLKDQINPMKDEAIQRLMQLKPVRFHYKGVLNTIFKELPQIQEGFVADELQQVIPSAVNGEKDALTKDGAIQPQTVNPMPVIALLTKALQEQQKQIDDLKAIIAQLQTAKSPCTVKQ